MLFQHFIRVISFDYSLNV
uniref:Uncharacterized protein n=1 Tax=Anguilla anguilla TaxID=7936 RepID=A0A0E9T6F2_ANGAN